MIPRAARSLRFEFLLVRFFMPERIQKPVEPAPWEPKQGDGGGPRSPEVSRQDTKDLLKKMRKVDPNQSKRYRQRTGQWWTDHSWDLTRKSMVRMISLSSYLADIVY